MRVTTVAKARQDAGTCGKCGATLGAGSAYRWWKSRFGPKRVRCMARTCDPKPSELVTNEVTSAALGIAETTEDAIGGAESVGEVNDAMEEAASNIQSDVIEACEEKMSNIESGFGHTDIPAYAEIEERKDEYESWMSAVEGWQGDDIDLTVVVKDAEGVEWSVDYAPGDNCFSEEDALAAVVEAEVPEASREAAVAQLREAFADALEEARSGARDALGECPA